MEPRLLTMLHRGIGGHHRASSVCGGDGLLGRLLGRSLIAETRAQAVTVAIASGKGGTGKTFVATNLTVALGERSVRSTLVDCDFGLGNAHLLLGLNPHLTMQHVLASETPMLDARIDTGHGSSLIAGGSGISRLADLDEGQFLKFARGLTEVASDQDVVLLDTAAGISPQCLLTLLAADHVVIVTNPEIAALTDAYALVKCLSRQSVQPSVSVIVNRVTTLAQGQPTWQKLADVSRRFTGCSLHYLGAIPEEPAATHRRLGQAPLLISRPECPASVSLRAILDRLDDLVGGLRPRQVAGMGRIDVRLRRVMASNG